MSVRPAGPDDLAAVGRLLHDFNVEYEEVTPPPETIAERIGALIRAGDTAVLVTGAGPDGLAVLRFRPSIWTEGLECYLAELYVVPALRGRGLGRALMNEVDLNTAEDDTAARALYESLGFDNRGGNPDGPANYYYGRLL